VAGLSFFNGFQCGTNRDRRRQGQNGIPIRDHGWPVACGHKLNDVIFMFIVTYHKLLEIKLFVVAGSFTGCVFVL
jgi:hypothetical protein